MLICLFDWVGVSAAATVVGRVIDAHGARAGFAVPLVCGLVAVLLAVAIAARGPGLRADA